MSQYFTVAGATVWNPATRVAQLFFRTAEAMTVIAENPHGMVDLGWDEYDIDLPAYRLFTEELTSQYLRATHPVLITLIGGFLPMAVALLRAADGEVPLLERAAAGQPIPRGTDAVEKARSVLTTAADLAISGRHHR
jgi:hypothetical protein